MARLQSYNWNYADGVCKKHLLPEIPCPACLAEAETDPDIYLELSKTERSPFFMGEFLIPDSFNADLHQVH